MKIFNKSSKGWKTLIIAAFVVSSIGFMKSASAEEVHFLGTCADNGITYGILHHHDVYSDRLEFSDAVSKKSFFITVRLASNPEFEVSGDSVYFYADNGERMVARVDGGTVSIGSVKY